MAIKLRGATRNGFMFLGFFGYHIVKFFLWRVGYFTKFFYR